MTPFTLARATTFALLLGLIAMANNNTAYAQPPAKKKLPAPPPADPIERIEKALDKLDKRLEAVETDVKTLKADVATLKDAKSKTDAKTKELATRVGKTESRITTLETRPPLTLKEYKTVYKVEPPTYIYVRKTTLLRDTYTYSDGRLYLFVVTSDDWVLVTK